MPPLDGRWFAGTRQRIKDASHRLIQGYDTALAFVWFGAALATMLWVWGLEPLAFIGDEAVNRMAAELIREIGRPVVDVPLPDPEDLLHMHEWTTLGSQAVPIYPPVTFYLYGLLLRLGVIGQFLILAMPASAAAAFFFGTARLLPPTLRWLAVPAPLLGMPAMYWLLRPWTNMSLLLTAFCWAFCWWTLWRERKSTGYLAAMLFSTGAAAAVRPDYAAHLLTAALLFALAVEPRRYRSILGLAVASGFCAVAVNLLLNRAVSGTSFRPVYETVLDRDHGVESAGRFGLLLRLWFPMGIPSAGEVFGFIERYWIELGQLKWLLAAQLTLIPLFIRTRGLSLLFYALGFLALLLLMVSHVHQELFGVDAPEPLVQHSIPRYWTPMYLLAAVPPIVLLGGVRFRSVLAVGAVLAVLLSWSTLDGIFRTQTTSFPKLRDNVRNAPRLLNALSRHIPPDAIVYSISRHGQIWSRFRLGLIGDIPPTVESIDRCMSAGIPVFLYGSNIVRIRRPLQRGLAKKGLTLVTVNRRLAVFQVRRAGEQD